MGRPGALAAAWVVAPAVEQFAAELLLQGLGQIDGCDLGETGGPHLRQKLRKFNLQGRKQLGQPCLADVGLKGLGQDFPGAARHRFSSGELAGLLAPQGDQLLEGRSEGREVVTGAGLLPHGITARLGLGQGDHQARIQAALALQLQAQQLQVAPPLGWGVATELGLGGGNEIGILRAALALMQLTGQQSQLLPAPSRTGARHHRVLVVVKGAADRAQQAGVVQMAAETRQGGSSDSHAEPEPEPASMTPGLNRPRMAGLPGRAAATAAVRPRTR